MSWIRKKRSVCFSVVTDGWRKSTVPCYCVESLRVTSLNLLFSFNFVGSCKRLVMYFCQSTNIKCLLKRSL